VTRAYNAQPLTAGGIFTSVLGVGSKIAIDHLIMRREQPTKYSREFSACIQPSQYLIRKETSHIGDAGIVFLLWYRLVQQDDNKDLSRYSRRLLVHRTKAYRFQKRPPPTSTIAVRSSSSSPLDDP
jgi:hypothetical protein